MGIWIFKGRKKNTILLEPLTFTLRPQTMHKDLNVSKMQRKQKALFKQTVYRANPSTQLQR